MKVQSKWGEVTILMEKPGKHCLSQVMKVNIIGDKTCHWYGPFISCDENGTLPQWSSSQASNLSLTMKNHETDSK